MPAQYNGRLNTQVSAQYKSMPMPPVLVEINPSKPKARLRLSAHAEADVLGINEADAQSRDGADALGMYRADIQSLRPSCTFKAFRPPS